MSTFNKGFFDATVPMIREYMTASSEARSYASAANTCAIVTVDGLKANGLDVLAYGKAATKDSSEAHKAANTAMVKIAAFYLADKWDAKREEVLAFVTKEVVKTAETDNRGIYVAFGNQSPKQKFTVQSNVRDVWKDLIARHKTAMTAQVNAIKATFVAAESAAKTAAEETEALESKIESVSDQVGRYEKRLDKALAKLENDPTNKKLIKKADKAQASLTALTRELDDVSLEHAAQIEKDAQAVEVLAEAKKALDAETSKLSETHPRQTSGMSWGQKKAAQVRKDIEALKKMESAEFDIEQALTDCRALLKTLTAVVVAD